MILVENLSLKYSKNSSKVVDNVSFKVKKNEFITIVGDNGSGKSTLFQSIIGLIPHMIECNYDGKVRINGAVVSTTRMEILSQMIGSVFQVPETQFVTSSVYHELAFALENQQMDPLIIQQKVKTALINSNLEDFERRSPYSLSAGEQQLVILSAILMLEPLIICLDEPSSMLDYERKKAFLEKLEEYVKRGGTVILTTLYPQIYWNITTRLIYLKKGKIEADLPIEECQPGKIPINYLPFNVVLRNKMPNEFHSIINQLSTLEENK